MSDRSVLKTLVPCVLTACGFVVLVQMPAVASDALVQPQSVQQVQTTPPVAGCPALPPFRAQLVADWAYPAQQIQPLSHPEGEVPMSVGTKVRVKLLPSEKVSLVWQEEEGKTVKFAGLLTFRTGRAGGYRFLTTPYVWLELVPIDTPNQKAYASSTDRRFKCYDIKKNIVFQNLHADTQYWLQVSGSPLEEVEMLIAEPEAE